MGSGEIRASQGAVHARHGAGQYLTDIPPEAVGGATRATAGGLLSLGQLSTRLFRVPWNARRLSDYVAIDVAGLEVIEVAPNIFLIAGESALKVGGRIVRHGVTLP